MVIGASTRVVKGVLGHELHDLERALLAVDVGEPNVSLPRFHRASRASVMHEQAIAEHRDLRRVLDRG